MDNQPLHPLHHSMRNHVIRRTPRDMSAVALDYETSAALTKVVLSIFTDCINIGKPLQDALLAVYLSGMNHAIEAKKENDSAAGNEPEHDPRRPRAIDQ